MDLDFPGCSRYVACMIDTRFSTALQIMIVVAVDGERNVRCTSNTLAANLNTNASFVRKMLMQLGEAGVISSSAGNGGGVRLARRPNQIKLNEIYQAVMAQSRLMESRTDVGGECSITGKLAQFSEQLCQRAEAAVTDLLSSLTLQNSLDELNSTSGVHTPGPEGPGSPLRQSPRPTAGRRLLSLGGQR
jgi:Rrf2 family transcriptional regulator, repressor of oqxAB